MIAAIKPLGEEWDLNRVPTHQSSCKYASSEFALSIASGAVMELLYKMLNLAYYDYRRAKPRIDIRYWPHLEVGQYPGIPHWHYDIYNDPNHPKASQTKHMVFIDGADCVTEFESGFIKERVIYTYGHTDRHRITAARKAGPRLLIRISHAPEIPFQNKVREPTIYEGNHGIRET